MEAAEALSVITKESPIPVIADIHFDYRLALAAIDAGVSALRLNPGNIGGRDRVEPLSKRPRNVVFLSELVSMRARFPRTFWSLRSSYGPCYGRSGLAAHPHP